MPTSKADKEMDETKRIMERMVKTPPDHRVANPKKKGGDKKPPPRRAVKADG